MRTPNLGSVFYIPNDPPEDPKDLARYLREEQQKVAAAISALAAGHLDKSTVAPAKPRDGDIRYASGAPGWDPGSGVGIYYYKLAGPGWVFLG